MTLTTDRLTPSVEAVLKPRSIAVVGASATSFWNRELCTAHGRLGYPGRVAAVNPRYATIEDVDCYPSLAELPFVPDLVQVLVGRDRVLDVIEQAAELGCRAAVVYAFGFAEAGREGQQLQDRMVLAARGSGMAVLGPNALGAVSFVHRTFLFLERLSEYKPGSVALLSQSGAMANTLVSNHLGVRWSHAVSVGNEAVLTASDFLSYFIDDPHTKVVVAFLETIRDPERFVAECARAREVGMPVLVLKTGRSAAGAAAAVAHSGALSTPDRLIDALLRRYGVPRLDNLDELLGAAVAAQGPVARGPRIASVSASGGHIEVLLDEATRHGLEHPELSLATLEALRRLVPERPIANPLDLGDYDETLADMLGILAADPSVDIVLNIVETNQVPAGVAGRDQRCLDAALSARERTDKPIVLVAPLGGSAPAADVGRALENGVVYLSGFPAAMRAIDATLRIREPAAAPATPRRLDPVRINVSMNALDGAARSGAPGTAVLEAAGIPTIPGASVQDVDGALAAAAEFGFPVVMKTGDADALHKTESGGVVLDIRSRSAARAAATRLFGAGATAVLVQPFLTGGVELIVGVTYDRSLRTSFVVVGIGGIYTEVLDDVAIRPVNLRQAEAVAMLDELRGSRLLSGARGQAPIDRSAVAEIIERVDALALVAGDRIESIDINPVIALADGAYAVDALIVPRIPAPD